MSDLISRKMVITAIEEMQLPIMRSEWESDQFKFSALAEVREMISGIPSAHQDDRLNKIAELVNGTIDHFDIDDAMDLLYQIKEVLK